MTQPLISSKPWNTPHWASSQHLQSQPSELNHRVLVSEHFCHPLYLRVGGFWEGRSSDIGLTHSKPCLVIKVSTGESPERWTAEELCCSLLTSLTWTEHWPEPCRPLLLTLRTLALAPVVPVEPIFVLYRHRIILRHFCKSIPVLFTSKVVLDVDLSSGTFWWMCFCVDAHQIKKQNKKQNQKQRRKSNLKPMINNMHINSTATQNKVQWTLFFLSKAVCHSPYLIMVTTNPYPFLDTSLSQLSS